MSRRIYDGSLLPPFSSIIWTELASRGWNARVKGARVLSGRGLPYILNLLAELRSTCLRRQRAVRRGSVRIFRSPSRPRQSSSFPSYPTWHRPPGWPTQDLPMEGGGIEIGIPDAGLLRKSDQILPIPLSSPTVTFPSARLRSVMSKTVPIMPVGRPFASRTISPCDNTTQTEPSGRTIRYSIQKGLLSVGGSTTAVAT